MNELKIVRGTGMSLYADNQPLFGVTAFSSAEAEKYHEVYEYLNATACERIKQGEEYQLKAVFLTLFENQLPEGAFILRVSDGETEYRYENCRVTGRKRQVKENQAAVAVVTMTADSMRKRGTEENG